MTTRIAPRLASTYRLQLNASFTLRDAAERVPYLAALGVSHLYCSPVLTARPGSTHGYDVADPTRVSEELGGEEALRALAERVRAHDMGILLDIVPNHMGIGPDNPFWDDVLAHGRQSRYASWFDVEWRGTTRRLAGKVMLPVLGDTLEHVLERDEISLDMSERGVRVRYFDHHFPIDPATIPPEIEVGMRDPVSRQEMHGWGRGVKGRSRLEALLAEQHYELAYWRWAQRDLNYRRFFDVNELICLRVEREDVFDATHATVLRLVAEGLVDGLRIDHIDGLLEPRRYLERLRAAVDARRPSGEGGARFPIVVEKILAPGEALPGDWPVDGTTGYEFLVTLEDALIDPAGYDRLEARYRARGGAPDFHAVALLSKRRVLRAALNADVRRIAPMLARLARAAGWGTPGIAACAGAIVELTSVLPVYRTYIDAESPDVAARDRAVLEGAFASVRERRIAREDAVTALERALMGSWRDAPESLGSSRLSFVLRWQQLSGPAAAKGVEDTALYVHAPLASRCEVGGDPGVPLGDAVPRLHALLHARAERMPRSLNATNTHDTKRSADVRARLDALSENAPAWERRLRQWRRSHHELRTLVRGRMAPTRATDNFIYQSLVGVWPIGAGPSRDADAVEDARRLGELRDRLTGYIQKAVREAKVSTSWTDPDAQYEEAIAGFVAALLDRRRSGSFLRAVEQFSGEITLPGIWNSLSRLVLHLTAPGVPDVYQGDELWFQALVDPDNRRPVDWQARSVALDALGDLATAGSLPSRATLGSWLLEPAASPLKMWITGKLLHIRRSDVAFMAPKYVALSARGSRAANAIAFRRASDASPRIVAVARLTGALGTPPVGEAWQDTSLDSALPGVARWRCLLSGVEVSSREGHLPLRDVFGRLPVAVLAPAS